MYRATPHSATGLSPVLLALGRELKLPMDVSEGSVPEVVSPMTEEEHKAIIAKRLH